MLGFIFDPLLSLPPVISVTIFAIVIIIIINVCYKFLVNQQEAKQIKDRVKELSDLTKQERKAGNTAKVTELMSETMRENSKLMRLTMKPMLASLFIILLFLPWLSGNFDTTGELIDNKGNVTLDNELYSIQMDGEQGTIIKEGATVASFTSSASEEERRFQIGKKYYVITYEEAGGFPFAHPDQVKFSTAVALLPEGVSLPLFGSEFGWLGWYLVISVPMMLLIRKSLKINI